jgi:hypothetical protein
MKMQRSSFSSKLAVLCLVFVFVLAAESADYSGIARLHPDYTLSWTITTQGTATGAPVISLTMQVNCVCWIGLGWHPQNASASGMSQADFVVATFNGRNVSVTDRYSTPSNGGYGAPVLDTDIGGANNILAWSAFQVRRPSPLQSLMPTLTLSCSNVNIRRAIRCRSRR